MKRTSRGMTCAFVAIYLLSAVTLMAQSEWSGTATLSRLGEFPDSGNYASSSSFQKNTLIEVTNLQNDKRATVIIVDRVSDPGLFMLLSRDAADDLGIGAGEIVQVRAILAQVDSLVRDAADDRALSQDPDINPAAIVASEAMPVISSDDGRTSDAASLGPVAWASGGEAHAQRTRRGNCADSSGRDTQNALRS